MKKFNKIKVRISRKAKLLNIMNQTEKKKVFSN